ncbi:MAG: FAD-binding oxidoreductase, partial [Acidimicrobiia bacterium]
GVLLPQVLELLPLWLGDGHRVLPIRLGGAPSFLMLPASERVICLAVVPMGVAGPLVSDTLAALEGIHTMLVEAGGKRYPSGWLGMMGADDWRRHFGDRWDAWQDARHRFDPAGIFCSALDGIPS